MNKEVPFFALCKVDWPQTEMRTTITASLVLSTNHANSSVQTVIDYLALSSVFTCKRLNMKNYRRKLGTYLWQTCQIWNNRCGKEEMVREKICMTNHMIHLYRDLLEIHSYQNFSFAVLYGFVLFCLGYKAQPCKMILMLVWINFIYIFSYIKGLRLYTSAIFDTVVNYYLSLFIQGISLGYRFKYL